MKAFLSGVVGTAIFAALTIWCMCGCETNGNEEAGLSISPAKTKVAFGQSVVLTAQGGWDYTWSIEQPAYGKLSSYNGKEVTYTAPDASIVSNVSSNELPLSDKVRVSSASNQTAKAVITIVEADE